MRVFVIIATLSALVACSGPEKAASPNLSPAPREAPDEFDEAPRDVGAGAPAPGAAAKDAARFVCNGLGDLDSADDQVAYLNELAAAAGDSSSSFRRFVTLLRRAIAKGKRPLAEAYLDRLGGLCEDAVGRRSF